MTSALRTLRRLAKEARANPTATWRGELARWSEDQLFAWEERSAVLAVDGGLPQEEAERRAFEELRNDTTYVT